MIWRTIPGIPGYAVSTEGDVFSFRTHKVLRPYRASGGTRVIKLTPHKKPIQKQVHQLVARAFWYDFRWGSKVGHINGDASDNRLANLYLRMEICERKTVGVRGKDCTDLVETWLSSSPPTN